MKAFRELQLLHRVWKEEIGPVDREHREAIWNEFSEITKQMHDKREGLYAEARAKESDNLAVKKRNYFANYRFRKRENRFAQWMASANSENGSHA